ncbi:MAG: hypothetical protein AAFV07_18495 [Bacteroidota bacterium]
MRPYTDLQPLDMEALIRTKDFAELSMAERAQVLIEMSEREYHELREIAQLTSLYFAEEAPRISPRAETRTNLMQAFRRQKNKDSLKGKIKRTLSYPLPAWQAAAAVVVLMLAVYLGPRVTPTEGTLQDQQHVLVDTAQTDSALRQLLNPGEDSAIIRTRQSAL